jgi:hypothetical protein
MLSGEPLEVAESEGYRRILLNAIECCFAKLPYVVNDTQLSAIHAARKVANRCYLFRLQSIDHFTSKQKPSLWLLNYRFNWWFKLSRCHAFAINLLAMYSMNGATVNRLKASFRLLV